MKIYTATFTGHYLGGDALIFAINDGHALRQLAKKLEEHRLAARQEQEPALRLHGNTASWTAARCIILNDGDY